MLELRIIKPLFGGAEIEFASAVVSFCDRVVVCEQSDVVRYFLHKLTAAAIKFFGNGGCPFEFYFSSAFAVAMIFQK